MNINDVIKFEFMEPPEQETIIMALRQLYYLDAIDENGDITTLGE